MSTEDNKALIRRLIEEVWNQGNLAVFDELYAPDFIFHDPGLPQVRTREDSQAGVPHGSSPTEWRDCPPVRPNGE